MNAERLLPVPSVDDIHKIRMDMMHNEFSKEPVNVGTPGHIDHGDNIDSTRRSARMWDYQPEEIEYDMDDWKARPEPSSKFVSDQRNSGKKRNKAKAKAQKKARKLTRRK